MALRLALVSSMQAESNPASRCGKGGVGKGDGEMILEHKRDLRISFYLILHHSPGK